MQPREPNISKPTVISLTDKEISVDSLVRKITLPSTGAVVFFTGVVREVSKKTDSQVTKALEYEAYAPMAEERMKQVVDEIRKNWPEVEGVVVLQRVGRMEAGTITTVVACSAAHRDSGVFEAARYGIDRLKEIVPIWKKEIGPGGEAWVEGHYHPRPGE